MDLQGLQIKPTTFSWGCDLLIYIVMLKHDTVVSSNHSLAASGHLWRSHSLYVS